ncbi:TetR/AcrR family transcriptional regulator [Sphaerisporangium sp. NPDC051011]|uniref:TetR/AcrR family transcriptional regulator n=1 Tax=Sphaerisporangium sp. NPDC051011 TaxID=3155792 RepID=UPI0033E3153E
MADSENESRSSRDRILIAAATMLGENPAAQLSVRAVAARAGVSTGSLRYHFPTQRVLLDTVLAGIYDLVAPGDPIHDRSIPARDRLVECLRQVLAPVEVGERAREAWRKTYESFLASEPTSAAREAHFAMARQAQQRVEYWLSALADEGALPDGDITRRARFLNTVLNGLSIERALPTKESVLQSETDTLYMAVDSVLSPPPTQR